MSNNNLYSQLAFHPALERWELSPDLEALAQRIVKSGRLRLNADTEKNFLFHIAEGHEHAFSYRELTDASLLPETRERLRKTLPGHYGDAGLEEQLRQLQANAQKLRLPAPEIELKTARVLVQSAHPAVIALLLAEGAELFVSFAHSVGDLMPAHHWTTRGNAGGLQLTDWEQLAIYVSAGGNPFFTGGNKTYASDGFEALARFVTIAAQEIGHYADLVRLLPPPQGEGWGGGIHGTAEQVSPPPNLPPVGGGSRIAGRYSAQFYPRYQPSPACKAARDADRTQLMQLAARLLASPLPALAKAEEGMAFIRKHRGISIRLGWYAALKLVHMLRLWIWIQRTAEGEAVTAIAAARLYPEPALGHAVLSFLADMQFNLAPNAEAYRDPDPLAEEATLCVEALARVPQQVAKWRDKAVRTGWPNLYALYYSTVIPGVIAALGHHNLQYRPARPLSWQRRCLVVLRRQIT